MAEDIYFDASHKFREPRKFKKSSYKPKGKEYKYIDPAEGLIQQVETKIVKPKRMKKVKKDLEPVEKRLTKILEKKRKFQKHRQVYQTVDPEELKRIQAFQERAIVPSTKMEMERQQEEKEKTDKAQKDADAQAQQLLEEGRHQDLIEGLKNVAERPLPMRDIEPLYKSASHAAIEQKLESIGFQDNPQLAIALTKYMIDNGLVENADDVAEIFTPILHPTEEPDEADKAQNEINRRNLFDRGRFAIKIYNDYKQSVGRGLFGGKLANIHPHLLGTVIAHDYIHRNADKILAKLPAKHKGIKELEQLKKNANRAVVMSNKLHGKGFGDFFKKMIEKGKTLVNFYNQIPDAIRKPFEEKAKEAGRQQIQKASLFLKDKFAKK